MPKLKKSTYTNQSFSSEEVEEMAGEKTAAEPSVASETPAETGVNESLENLVEIRKAQETELEEGEIAKATKSKTKTIAYG